MPLWNLYGSAGAFFVVKSQIGQLEFKNCSNFLSVDR